MLLSAVAAIAVAAGAPPGAVVIAMLAALQPMVFMVGVVAWAGYHHWGSRTRHGSRGEAAFLEAVAAEVRGGSSLRHAIAEAAGRSELDLDRAARAALLGRPMAEVGAALESALAINGRIARPALAMAAEAGARVGPLFDGLALGAAEAADAAREQRVATAQARLSAWLVAGLPAVAAVAIAVIGDGGLFASAPGVTIGVVGLGLLAAGAVTVWLMLRKAQT